MPLSTEIVLQSSFVNLAHPIIFLCLIVRFLVFIPFKRGFERTFFLQQQKEFFYREINCIIHIQNLDQTFRDFENEYSNSWISLKYSLLFFVTCHL